MARFVVVLVVLVAVAVVAWKYLMKGGDPMPADRPAAAAADGSADEKLEAKGEKASQDEQAANAKTGSEKGAASKDGAAVAGGELAKKDAENQLAKAAPAATVSTDINPEAAEVAAPESGAKDEQRVTGADIARAMPEETIMLGDPSLTTGIPGEGPVTMEQIDAWLDDPKNHVVLIPELPLGLDAGAGEIKGLDENPLTRAKIELGRQLFFDQRLSQDNSISCASCHDPDVGYASRDRFGIGVKKQQGNRNSPTAYNRILSEAQFWDGRAPTLEEQAKGPIANPIEMSNTHEACVGTLKKIPGYVRQFERIFDEGLTIETAARAIASFERAIVTGPAPWDVYVKFKTFKEAYEPDLEDLEALEEDDPELYEEYRELEKMAEENPISDSARRGGDLFFSEKSGCTACHLGANFTDEKYHNLGVGIDAEDPDLGRYDVTEKEEDKGAFKTPTCRNVAMTAPYMHDGSQKTLEEVVEWYVKGGHPNQWLDKNIKKLDLSDQDKADLVAFMKEGLTGSLPKVERTRLPADPLAEALNEEAAEEAEAEAEAKDAAGG